MTQIHTLNLCLIQRPSVNTASQSTNQPNATHTHTHTQRQTPSQSPTAPASQLARWPTFCQLFVNFLPTCCQSFANSFQTHTLKGNVLLSKNSQPFAKLLPSCRFDPGSSMFLRSVFWLFFLDNGKPFVCLQFWTWQIGWHSLTPNTNLPTPLAIPPNPPLPTPTCQLPPCQNPVLATRPLP